MTGFPYEIASASARPEALAAMERDEAVARRQEGVSLPRLDVAVDDEDVGPVGDGRPQLLELPRAALPPIHALEDERRALTGRERGAKGVDEAERVLPLRADEVEEVEEDEARGKPELARATARGSAGASKGSGAT